jgi:crossover junction endodeoxyribonuclease RusA
VIAFDVTGTPAPKGSSRAFTNRHTGKASLVPGGSKVNRENLKSWDREVRTSALEALGPRPSGPVFVKVPLAVSIEFRLARPGGHWHPKKGLKTSAPVAPASKPDLDKLARSTLDSLTGLAFDDDSRIVRLAVTKVYADPGREGARITVQEWKR